jgi:hypothetical protein
MNKMVLPLTMTVLLSLGGLAARADSAAGPSGFHSATESAQSNGETGESADCPIKKTVDGKTFCFQNDPALAKPQGGH